MNGTDGWGVGGPRLGILKSGWDAMGAYITAIHRWLTRPPIEIGSQKREILGPRG